MGAVESRACVATEEQPGAPASSPPARHRRNQSGIPRRVSITGLKSPTEGGGDVAAASVAEGSSTPTTPRRPPMRHARRATRDLSFDLTIREEGVRPAEHSITSTPGAPTRKLSVSARSESGEEKDYNQASESSAVSSTDDDSSAVTSDDEVDGKEGSGGSSGGGGNLDVNDIRALLKSQAASSVAAEGPKYQYTLAELSERLGPNLKLLTAGYDDAVVGVPHIRYTPTYRAYNLGPPGPYEQYDERLNFGYNYTPKILHPTPHEEFLLEAAATRRQAEIKKSIEFETQRRALLARDQAHERMKHKLVSDIKQSVAREKPVQATPKRRRTIIGGGGGSSSQTRDPDYSGTQTPGSRMAPSMGAELSRIGKSAAHSVEPSRIGRR